MRFKANITYVITLFQKKMIKVAFAGKDNWIVFKCAKKRVKTVKAST